MDYELLFKGTGSVLIAYGAALLLMSLIYKSKTK